MLPNELKANKNNLEDGKILTCIEYPGYVQNSINKCLKTLGTIPKVLSSYQSHKKIFNIYF